MHERSSRARSAGWVAAQACALACAPARETLSAVAAAARGTRRGAARRAGCAAPCPLPPAPCPRSRTCSAAITRSNSGSGVAGIGVKPGGRGRGGRAGSRRAGEGGGRQLQLLPARSAAAARAARQPCAHPWRTLGQHNRLGPGAPWRRQRLGGAQQRLLQRAQATQQGRHSLHAEAGGMWRVRLVARPAVTRLAT